MEDESYQITKGVELPQPESLRAAKRISTLLIELESRLNPVLRPSQPQSENKDTVSKSELVTNLDYLQMHVKDILSRLHI